MILCSNCIRCRAFNVEHCYIIFIHMSSKSVSGIIIKNEEIGNESVPIQLAQCWSPGLAIFNANIQIYFSNKMFGSNFVKQHSETVMV